MILRLSLSISYTQQLIDKIKLSFSVAKILAVLFITIVSFNAVGDGTPSTTAAFLKNSISTPTTSISAGEWVPEAPSLFGWNLITVLETDIEKTQNTCNGEVTLDETSTHLPIYRWQLVEGENVAYQQELILPDGSIENIFEKEQLEWSLPTDLSSVPGLWRVRVRAFSDDNLSGTLDETEDRSKWSDSCDLVAEVVIKETGDVIGDPDPTPVDPEIAEVVEPVLDQEQPAESTTPSAKIYQQELYNATFEINNVTDYSQAKTLIEYTHLFEGLELSEGIEDVLIVGNLSSLEKTNIYLASCSEGGICMPHLGIIPESVKLTVSLYQEEILAEEFTVNLTGGWEEEQQ